ncbi:NADH-quinone oxidoreductase subunit N [Anoxybacillus sp. BCO1]|nr:NADH-quinone oxidoreductase subunit N [Anoxybacillus sp. BCO1]
MLMTLAPYIAFLAGVTMIIGNTIALRQRNVKRMLAYSSIAHAGYVLVAFASLSMFMFEAIWFYLFAYVFMTIGAFAILQVVSQHHDDEDISIFAGLYRRSPLMAVAMTIFLLSLAGIPGTAGFIGKMNIFLGAFVVEPAHYVLASIMVVTTVISYVYYFGIFRPNVFPTCRTCGSITMATRCHCCRCHLYHRYVVVRGVSKLCLRLDCTI